MASSWGGDFGPESRVRRLITLEGFLTSQQPWEVHLWAGEEGSSLNPQISIKGGPLFLQPGSGQGPGLGAQSPGCNTV